MKWDSIIAGLAVAGVNGALALAVIRWGWGKGMQVFMIAFFGGMIARFIAVAVLSALALKWAEVHAASYVIALVAAYLLFLVFEILYVLKLQGRSKPRSKSP